MCAAQEQALLENSIKNHIDGQDVSPMYRLCDESSETVMHLSSGCTVLAKHIHWLLPKKHRIRT